MFEVSGAVFAFLAHCLNDLNDAATDVHIRDEDSLRCPHLSGVGSCDDEAVRALHDSFRRIIPRDRLLDTLLRYNTTCYTCRRSETPGYQKVI